MTEEPSDLPALIGGRKFLNEFLSHSKSTGRLTYVRMICAKDYTGEMSGMIPVAVLARLGSPILR